MSVSVSTMALKRDKSLGSAAAQRSIANSARLCSAAVICGDSSYIINLICYNRCYDRLDGSCENRNDKQARHRDDQADPQDPAARQVMSVHRTAVTCGGGNDAQNWYHRQIGANPRCLRCTCAAVSQSAHVCSRRRRRRCRRRRPWFVHLRTVAVLSAPPLQSLTRDADAASQCSSCGCTLR